MSYNIHVLHNAFTDYIFFLFCTVLKMAKGKKRASLLRAIEDLFPADAEEGRMVGEDAEEARIFAEYEAGENPRDARAEKRSQRNKVPSQPHQPTSSLQREQQDAMSNESTPVEIPRHTGIVLLFLVILFS